MNGDRPGFFGRLKAGLTRSAQRLTEGIAAIVIKKKLDQQSLDELEELLIGADLGLGLAQQITEKLKRTRFNQEISNDEIRATLAESIVAALQPASGRWRSTPAQSPSSSWSLASMAAARPRPSASWRSSMATAARKSCLPPATRSAPPRSNS